jgi:hypothetical protein
MHGSDAFITWIYRARRMSEEAEFHVCQSNHETVVEGLAKWPWSSWRFSSFSSKSHLAMARIADVTQSTAADTPTAHICATCGKTGANYEEIRQSTRAFQSRPAKKPKNPTSRGSATCYLFGHGISWQILNVWI